jgi:hypothetical protein
MTGAFAAASSGRSPFAIELIGRHLLRSEVAASRNRSQKDAEIPGQTGLAIDIAAASC